jgi:hypothetical protein
MTRIVIMFFSLVFLTASCKKKEKEQFIYEFLVLRDNNMKMQPDTLPISFKNAIENGKYKLNDVNGQVICEGKFSGGFKVREWTYHPTDASTVAIDWSKYTNDSSKVEINYPSDWKTLEDPERPFQAVFPLKSGENDKGKYFIILSHNKDSIDLDLFGYQRYYKSEMFSTEKVKEYAHFVFETASGKTFYMMKYTAQRGNDEFMIFTFIGNAGPLIYDITYSSLHEDDDRKHIIFFDMIRSFTLDGQKFFSPYDPVKDFKRLEYQDRPKPTA